MKKIKIKNLAAVSSFLTFFTPLANAGPIAVYDGPAINWNASPACATFGDAVSCSLPYLNFLAGQSQNATGPTGYVVASPQGKLDQSIVVQAGGAAAADNSDTSPTPASVENSFKANDATSDSFRATGKADGSTMSAGNMADPLNHNLTAAQDNIGTWDVSATWLRDALTTSDGKRHELMVMFDYNQDQASTTSMNIWGLITLRDTDGNLTDINYEFRDSGYTPYNLFTSDKNFYSQPAGSEFETVSGTICFYSDGSGFPYPGGSCPKTNGSASLVTTIDNSQGTNNTEFAAFFPELNAGLEGYIAQGYDTVSVRLLMGCFGNPNDATTGQGYLASGQTTQCDTGGFGDVYIMAGAEMTTVAEPSTLALAALGLLGGGLYRRQRRT